MIPQTELIYNYEYARRIQGMTEEQFADPWQRIIRIGGDFEKVYAEYQQAMLEAIARYSGYDWAEYSNEHFPIYMIGTGPSFVHPLSLAVDEDPVTMLRDAIYQLTHRNMYFGFPTDEQRHAYTHAVVQHVLGELGVDTDTTSDIDLTNTPVKNYLSR